ncbi:hypothetical protein KORDIASMS9_04297 [Kordia sp. SMS9]|uniref:hypothetical protein n=1 Tax=Kordia sp. SMS9 TaxID=2282170 RepID=UPI000E0DDD0D|nr:hypothetical protein [Kordia sp. SMS9]AXG72035.1 hypothetical protein KORDIASMS9_04297 [Kordia sp. SMS9]
MRIKKYILFTLFGICISCSNKTDRSTIFGLEGNVKTYTELYYQAAHKFGEWQQGKLSEEFGNMKVSFERTGNYESLEFLDADHNLTEKMIPVREKGEIIEELRYNPEGELMGKMELTFRSDTKIKFKNLDVKDGITSKGISFIENDRIIRQEIILLDSYTPSDKRPKIFLDFEYDSKGRIISQKQTDQDGNVDYQYTFKHVEFDEHNNWTKRLDYDEKDTENPKKVVTRVYEYY